MEPFKNSINSQVVRDIAYHLHRSEPSFPEAEFIKIATEGLEDLELKARVVHLSQALGQTLPSDFDLACQAIEGALAPATEEKNPADAGLSGWAIWPLAHYVESYGLEHLERSLQVLHALTQRSTAEFAIRPFLQREPKRVLAVLKQWAKEPSPHVRRLVSEGTRPRLPWGIRLQGFVEDPSPCLPLLELLFDDESEYVRRSVSNHLNDISKDHPELAIRVAEGWLKKNSDDAVKKVVSHGLRTLIKQGNQKALALTGFHHDAQVDVAVKLLGQAGIQEGECLEFEVYLRNTSKEPIRIAVDYAIHYLRANGSHSAKVFKLSKPTLRAGESLTLTRRHSFVRVTTRAHYWGEHWLDIRVNGVAHGKQQFVLSNSGRK